MEREEVRMEERWTKVKFRVEEEPRFGETRISEHVERCGRRRMAEDADDQD